jgi:hypothetical protein
MKRTTAFAVLILAGLAVFWVVEAGNLEPPGPPAPTMVTLDEIWSGRTILGVAQTGQNGCWDESGVPIACAGTGQDGEYEKGVSVAPRFMDNADGTVTDNLTGLIWLQDADCFGQQDWITALSNANTLASASDSCTPDLTDSSVAGDWRLPNIKELQSLLDYGESEPALPAGHPFAGVQLDYYWSSTTAAGIPDNAWGALLNIGVVIIGDKTTNLSVLPVRGGQ